MQNSSDACSLLLNQIYFDFSLEVRSLFTFSSYNTVKIKFPLLFPLRQTKTKYCFENLGDRYYYCKDCSYDVDTSFCRNCFELEKHSDHNYTSYKEDGYCDCGMADRWNEKGFCSTHGKNYEGQEINERINQKQFLSFYRQCFQLYFRLLSNWEKKKTSIHSEQIFEFCSDFGKKLFQNLTLLNKKSLYYNHLTTEVFKMNVENRYNTKFSIFFNLIKIYGKYLAPSCKQLLFSMAPYSQFLYLFYKCLFEEIETMENLNEMSEISKFHKITYDVTEVLNKLADQNITIFSEFKETTFQILDYYFKVLKAVTSAKNRNTGILVPVWNCLRRKQILKIQSIPQIHLGRFMKEVQNDEELFRDLLPQFFHYLQNRIQNKLSNEQNKNNEIAFFVNEIVKLVFKTVKGNEGEFTSFFMSLSINPKIVHSVFLNYMKEVLSNLSKMNFLTVKAIINLNHLLLKKQLFQTCIFSQLWKQDIEEYKILRFTLAILKAMLAYQLKETWMLSKFLKGTESFEENEKIREKKFKEYLYMNKKIKKRCILYLKRNGFLDFENAGKILRQMTTYYSNNTQFIYKSQQIHKNEDLLLLNTEQIIPSIQYEPHEQDYRFTNQSRIFYLQQLFQNVFQFLTIQSSLAEEKIKKLKYSDILALVVMDKIMLGQQKTVRTALQNIKEVIIDWNMADHKIKHIFGLQKEQVFVSNNILAESFEKENEKKVLSKQENAFNSKKAKISERFAEKKLKMLSKLKVMEKKSQNQYECIICKDTGSQQNRLYYLAKVKNSPIFDAFSQKKSNFNSIISICFHLIHKSCFDKYKPNYSSKPCPLCSDQCNSLLPFEFENQSLIWEESVAKLLKKNEEFPLKVFGVRVLLQSLIFRNGLFNMFSPFTKNEEKINRYMFGLLEGAFRNLANEEKIQLDKQIEKMLKMSELNGSPEIGLIETILLQTFNRKMKGIIDPAPVKLIQKLRENISEEEFNRFYFRFKEISGFQYQIQVQQNKKNQLSIVECPPQSMSKLRKLRKFCQKCPLIECWYCILCKNVFCTSCIGINTHKKQSHNGYGLVLIINEGVLKISHGYSEKVFNIYENDFREKWFGEGKAKDYFLNVETYLEVIGNWIRNY